MAVPCPRCGREYDVALFPFGRTIHCACGSRVGLEPRRRPVVPPVRFAADAMLGRLARWLRLIGCDTRYAPDVSDAELARQAIEEDRVVLTRDRRLPEEWRVPHHLLIESEELARQLRQVVERYHVPWRSQLFTRCAACNSPVALASPDEVRERVPPGVAARYGEFSHCPACGRVYWPGSHVARVRKLLERTLG